jgi:hypothetical protein
MLDGANGYLVLCREQQEIFFSLDIYLSYGVDPCKEDIGPGNVFVVQCTRRIYWISPNFKMYLIIET